MTERDPAWISGFNAGVQAAWEVVNAMIGTLPAEPVTSGAKLMRDTALDIGDNILDLRRIADGERVQQGKE